MFKRPFPLLLQRVRASGSCPPDRLSSPQLRMHSPLLSLACQTFDRLEQPSPPFTYRFPPLWPSLYFPVPKNPSCPRFALRAESLSCLSPPRRVLPFPSGNQHLPSSLDLLLSYSFFFFPRGIVSVVETPALPPSTRPLFDPPPPTPPGSVFPFPPPPHVVLQPKILRVLTPQDTYAPTFWLLPPRTNLSPILCFRVPVCFVPPVRCYRTGSRHPRSRNPFQPR